MSRFRDFTNFDEVKHNDIRDQIADFGVTIDLYRRSVPEGNIGIDTELGDLALVKRFNALFSRERNVNKVTNEGIGRAMKNVYYFTTDYRSVRLNDVIKYDSAMYEVIAIDNAGNNLVIISGQKLS